MKIILDKPELSVYFRIDSLYYLGTFRNRKFYLQEIKTVLPNIKINKVNLQDITYIYNNGLLYKSEIKMFRFKGLIVKVNPIRKE